MSELGSHDSREMKHLTDELNVLLKKISQIVLPRAGVKGASYSLVTVILQSDSNPLQIAFKKAQILNVQGTPVKAQEDIDGYYIDPPGVCTTVPACIPE